MTEQTNPRLTRISTVKHLPSVPVRFLLFLLAFSPPAFGQNPQPTLTSLSAISGPVGMAVAITGTNFGSSQGTSRVTFNGTTATVTSWSATSLATSVPTGATTGNVVVTVGGVASDGVSFTVTSTCGESAQSGTDGQNADWGFATPCVTGSDANGYTPASIQYWVGNPTSTSFDLGIYADSSGSPGSLLCHTGTTTLTPIAGWNNNISLSGKSCPTLSASTRYWIGYITGSNTIQQGIVSGTCPGTSLVSVYASSEEGSAALPNPFGASAGTPSCYSIYLVLNDATVTPTVTSLSPPSGPVGTAVTIAGTNFGSTEGTSTVTFNGTTATVTTWSATSLATSVPTGATTGNVVVTVGGVASNGVSFTVAAPAPTITSLSAISGPVGTAVTITGANFGSTQGTSTVTFNGTTATVTSWSATSLATSVPTGATTGNVVVTVGGVASNGVSFTVTSSSGSGPAITSLSPTSGPVGTAVTIAGTNFGSTGTVTFNGTVATTTNWSATSIATSVPTGATTGNVVVTVGGVASNDVSFAVTAPAPTIASLSPTSGPVGTAVTIAGANFGSTGTVTFNGTVATTTNWSATSIATSVPTGATTGNVVVTVGGVASNDVSFTVTAPAPTIASLSPTSGPVGMAVAITGTNFGSSQGTSRVTFNGTTATVTSWSATSLATSVPTGATTGNVVVTVGGVASDGVSFTVTSTCGESAQSGTDGQNADWGFATPCVTGSDANGYTPASIQYWVGNPTSTSFDLGIYADSSGSPGSLLCHTGTTTLTPIAGWNNNISLSGKSCPTLSASTRYWIGYITGSNAIEQGIVSGTCPGTSLKSVYTSSALESAVLSNPFGATVGSQSCYSIYLVLNNATVTAPAPTITSLSPTSGPVGTAVTIAGANFGSTGTVTFNGTVATTTNWSATSIATSVPTGATTGNVVVTVGGVASNGVSFTVTSSSGSGPAITSLNPTSGPVGTAVTIAGTNFGSTGTVTFNGTVATTTSWSATSIATSVPTGATTGNVVVTVGGVASNSVSFTVTGGGAVVSLFPANLFFGNQALASTSPAQVITLNNTGTATLNIDSIAVTGTNASDFAQTNTCGSSVTVGGNCTITVTFTPELTTIESAAVTITSDAAGSPQTVGLNGGGQFMVLDPTKTYLVNGFTGKPVFVLGDSAYDLAINLSANSDIDLYLSTRQAQGFNTIWIASIDIAYAIDSPDNALGQAPFINMSTPFTDENEAYWEHLDYVLQRAAAYGFTVFLSPAQVGSGPSYCGDWCPYLESASTSTLTAYGTYLGNRYKNYPNIIWLLGGDLDLVDYPQLQAKVQAILNGIQSTDPNHMLTAAEEDGTTGPNTQDYHGGSPWPAGQWSLDSMYDGTVSAHASTANAAWTRSDHLPTLSQQDAYENDSSSGTNLQTRTEAYQDVLGGTTLGDFFGNDIIWAFGFDYAYSRGYTGPTQWKTWFNTSGATGRINLANLMRSREFWKMVPDTGHTVVTAGYGSGNTITTTGRTSDGQTIIAYIPNGNATTISVNMSQITSNSSTVHGWWFNPQTGATTDLDTFANTGTLMFTPPDHNDWVLVLDDASANLPAPGSNNL